MKFLILISLILFGCSGKKDVYSNQKLSKYEIENKSFNEKFKTEFTRNGECWADEYKIPYEAFFLKSKSILTPVNILLAKDKNVFLIGQAHPECEELFEYSKKCSYRIRLVLEEDIHIFYSKTSRKVHCPTGVTVKAILSKSTPEEKAIFDFDKILEN